MKRSIWASFPSALTASAVDITLLPVNEGAAFKDLSCAPVRSFIAAGLKLVELKAKSPPLSINGKPSINVPPVARLSPTLIAIGATVEPISRIIALGSGIPDLAPPAAS